MSIFSKIQKQESPNIGPHVLVTRSLMKDLTDLAAFKEQTYMRKMNLSRSDKYVLDLGCEDVHQKERNQFQPHFEDHF